MILGIAGSNDQNDGKHGIRIEILDERMMYINNFFLQGLVFLFLLIIISQLY